MKPWKYKYFKVYGSCNIDNRIKINSNLLQALLNRLVNNLITQLWLDIGVSDPDISWCEIHDLKQKVEVSVRYIWSGLSYECIGGVEVSRLIFIFLDILTRFEYWI